MAEDQVATVVDSTSSAEDFAAYYGFPQAEDDAPEAPADAEATEEVAEEDDTPVEADAADDEAAVDADVGTDTPEPTPAKKLPFSVTDAKGNDVATALANATVTFKADGTEQKLPLADVIRRAQSEAGVQRQLRAERDEKQSMQSMVQQREQEVEQLRALALRAVLDDDYRESLRPEVEQYYSPEARADRAEQQLAAERQAQANTVAERQRIAERVGFLEQTVAPIFTTLREKYPLVSEQELLGQFTADTQKWTVNGEIAPQFYPELERYLAGPWMDFASTRHAEANALRERAEKATRKAQVEEQKRKNDTAARSRPSGGVPPLRESAVDKKPSTMKEAQRQGLATLLEGLQ